MRATVVFPVPGLPENTRWKDISGHFSPIEHDQGEEPGTREIARTCDLVKELGVKALFVEPQYPQKAAETIARETGAGLYRLDPVVSGDSSKESYELIMRENARVLLEALAQ